jgi:ADP-ribose pyrophosphatase YjhB (NUDIX family)
MATESQTSLAQLIKGIDSQITDSKNGLGPELFLFVSRLTPLVNVDILLQRTSNDCQETLMTWRSDRFYRGWHFPGGVIRFKESMENRVRQVASLELGVESLTSIQFTTFNQKISDVRDERGHFISFLFKVTTNQSPNASKECRDPHSPHDGEWFWFSSPPQDILIQHKVYEKYFAKDEEIKVR